MTERRSKRNPPDEVDDDAETVRQIHRIVNALTGDAEEKQELVSELMHAELTSILELSETDPLAAVAVLSHFLDGLKLFGESLLEQVDRDDPRLTNLGGNNRGVVVGFRDGKFSLVSADELPPEVLAEMERENRPPPDSPGYL